MGRVLHSFLWLLPVGEAIAGHSSDVQTGTALGMGRCAVDNSQRPRYDMYIPQAVKTDQTGQGVHIILGRTGADLCPVAAVLGYIAICVHIILWRTGADLYPVAAVLGYIAILGARPDPFCLNSRGEPLLKHVFVAEIRQILDDMGFPQHQYTGHSFRIGAETAAALAGLEDSTIQLLGRWRSTAFIRYVRTPHDKLAALSSTLIRQENVGTWPSHHQHCCSQGPP